MHRKRAYIGIVIVALWLSTAAWAGSGEADGSFPVKDASLFAAAAVALLTWIGGQIVIPLSKYRWERRQQRALVLSIMRATADKTIDFFGERKSTSIFDKVLYQIDEQIDNARRNPGYFAHISVADDDSIKTRVMERDHFWLIDTEVVQAFIKFEENSSRARFMCRAVMDKEYVELVKKDRSRYLAALEQIRQHFSDWLDSTKTLQQKLRDIDV